MLKTIQYDSSRTEDVLSSLLKNKASSYPRVTGGRLVIYEDSGSVFYKVVSDPAVEAWCKSFTKHIAVVKRLRRNAAKLELKRRRKKSGR